MWIVGWGSNGEGRIGRSGGGNGLPVASFYGGAWPELSRNRPFGLGLGSGLDGEDESGALNSSGCSVE